jgi:hypothetical protein
MRFRPGTPEHATSRRHRHRAPAGQRRGATKRISTHPLKRLTEVLLCVAPRCCAVPNAPSGSSSAHQWTAPRGSLAARSRDRLEGLANAQRRICWPASHEVGQARTLLPRRQAPETSTPLERRSARCPRVGSGPAPRAKSEDGAGHDSQQPAEDRCDEDDPDERLACRAEHPAHLDAACVGNRKREHDHEQEDESAGRRVEPRVVCTSPQAVPAKLPPRLFYALLRCVLLRSGLRLHHSRCWQQGGKRQC